MLVVSEKNCEPGDRMVSVFLFGQRTHLVECVSAIFNAGVSVPVHRVGEHCKGEGGDERELYGGEWMLDAFRIGRSGESSGSKAVGVCSERR